MAIEIDKVERWMECFANSDIAQMTLEYENLKLKMKKGCCVAWQNGKNEDGAAGVMRETREFTGKKAETDDSEKSSREVKAPLAGVFYRAPGPGEAPFVEVGREVGQGEVIGLIEAMKMMNEVPSPCDGVVLDIPAKDGTFAEYDSVLVRIEEKTHV